MGGSGDKLILNAGSSSVKFRLYAQERILIDGVIDGVGSDTHIIVNGKTRKLQIQTYDEAGKLILELLQGQEPAIIVHRVTHGEYHELPAVITPALVQELKLLIPLSPLHLPPSIGYIEFFMQHTKAKHIACFDTMFHRSMPQLAKIYAIPQDVAKRHGIYRYGFHGLAHEAMLLEAQRLAGRSFSKVITCQLGSGASVCAILDGKSIDTSMGLTPLEGLVMGTRSGDIDPAAIIYLAHHAGMTPEAVLEMLEHNSGLKGIAGESDVRKLLQKEQDGDAAAALALDLFAYRVRKYIGSYIAALGGVECIVLSGGVPRAPRMRERILRNLEELGIVIDTKQLHAEMPVLLTKGRVHVWALEVDEQEHMRKLTENFRS